MNIIRFLHRKTDVCLLHDYKTVQQALRIMRSHGCAELPVVNQEGFYVGTVKEGDFLWYILDYGGFDEVKDHKISSVVQKSMVPALKITDTDEDLQKAALRSAFVPIVDDRDMFVGTISREDIIAYFVDREKEIQDAQVE